MKLYKLTEQFEALLELADNEEIPEDVFEDTLEALTGDIDENIDGLCSVIKTMGIYADSLKAEADTLAQRAKAKAARKERLQKHLSDMLQRLGRKKFENTHHNVRFNKGDSLVFTDPDQLFDWLEQHYPDKVTTQIVRNANKNDIKALEKAGVEIPFTAHEITMNISVK